jgi:hypothetical protein
MASRPYSGLGMDWRRKVTTHCAQGHEYTPDNTLWRAEGWRNCRACMNEAAKRYQAKKQQGRPGFAQ